MVTQINLIYSAAAVRRLLGLAANALVVVREWFSVVWVWVAGRSPRFMSKKKFLQHFADHRRNESKGLVVSKVVNFDNIFSVQNLLKNSFYQVYKTVDKVVCCCDDYRNQDTFLEGKKRCCKHGYAVLNYLGFQSLGDYLNQ